MRWTEKQLDEYIAELQQTRIKPDSDEPDPGPESKLQAKCLVYCKERGYPVWHDWSRKKNQPGFPDLIIFLPEGRVTLIELKAGTAKLRMEQEALHRQMLYLGHEIHVVRSFGKFLEILRGGDDMPGLPDDERFTLMVYNEERREGKE